MGAAAEMEFLTNKRVGGMVYIRTLALGPGAELDSGQLGITSKQTYYGDIIQDLHTIFC
jgi:hypothetical protein